MHGNPHKPITGARREIRVWDPGVRLFHWSLVLAVLVAFLAGEHALTVHVVAGYGVAVLTAWRIVWGFTGPATARFRDFVHPPRAILAFLRASLQGRPTWHAGHNPAGGAMVVVLLATLLTTALTGMALYGAQDAGGPLAFLATRAGEDAIDTLETLHEFLGQALPWLVAVHVAGVLVESLLQRVDLTRAMLTGRKPLPPTPEGGER